MDLDQSHDGDGSKFPLRVVISGISGKYPESANISEFKENLFNGVDMITDDPKGDRWPEGIFGIPKRCGKLNGLDKFDNQFFNVSAKQADFMDPQLRMLLELTHEAIFDAGINPATLRGKNIGVFVGASESESSNLWTQNVDNANGYCLLGCQKSMFANRISFCFDFQGPSFTMDTACSSSLLALEKALNAIRNGECDAAIVGGASVLLSPISTLQFNSLNMLSPEGKCKSFDAEGNGYVRSEAAVAIFIQKKDVALRSYAEILHAKTNTDGHKELGVTFPSGQRQSELLEQVYEEAGIDPRDVVYVEAHGTGTQAGDPQELNAITQVFCKEERERPLLVGSVKSNMGHSEPCSGLCGVTKVVLAIQNGVLPSNLHFNTPNPKIPALVDGRIKVVKENTPWDGGLVAINSFGFGGANVHVVLRSNPKRDVQKIASELPLIVPFSGRTSESVETGLENLSSEMNNNGVDHERISLLQKLYQNGGISGHAYRGYAIANDTSNEKLTVVEVKETPEQSNPSIWFIFPGMGSQWKTKEWRAIGRQLMKLPVFAQSVLRSIKTIKSHNEGTDFTPFFLSDAQNESEELEKMEKSIIYSFVGIAAVQIALVDLLTSLNIHPDGIIGHSVGELACAYADGCFTAEQTILAAFFRGQATEAAMKSTTFVGAMAAVGLTWEEAKEKCPAGIYPACHNSIDSVTVSGPLDTLEPFVQNLQNEGIFAKLVDTNGLAFHSKYIQGAGPFFKEKLDTIIPEPSLRSNRWISSSVPEDQWDSGSDWAKWSSPSYHVNNVVSPVLFHEALQHVPKNAVVIETGPHCLLQSILKRALPECAHIGLVNKNKEDGIHQILQMTGQLFNYGASPNFSGLYKSGYVEFPVSAGTGSLSHIVSTTWDHSQSWNVAKFEQDQKNEMEISLDKESDKFYKGHKIDGRLLFPATGYLLFVWKAFTRLQSQSQGQELVLSYEDVPVVFEKVKLKKATVLPQVTDDLQPAPRVKFSLNIFKSTGEFQLSNAEDGTLLVSGIVRSPRDSSEFMALDPSKGQTQSQAQIQTPDILPLSTEDVYKELRLRGYEYSGEFQAIHKTDMRSENECERSEVNFHGNWVTFLDNFLQLTILSKPNRALYLPTFLDKVILDPVTFRRNLKRLTSDDDEDDDANNDSGNFKLLRTLQVPVYHFKNLQVVTCEGVQIQRCRAEIVQKRSDVPSNGTLVLGKQEFSSFFDTIQLSNSSITGKSFSSLNENSLTACLSIVLENSQDLRLQIVEVVQSPENSLANSVQEIILHRTSELCSVHLIQNLCLTESSCTTDESETVETVSSYFKGEVEDDLVILNNTENTPQFIENIAATLKKHTFLLAILPNKQLLDETFIKNVQEKSSVILVAHKISNNDHFYLFKKGSDNISTVQLFETSAEEKTRYHDHSNSKIIYIDQHHHSIKDSNNNILKHDEFGWIEPLKEAMKQYAVSDPENESSRIYLVSKETGNNASGILGLVNCLQKEPGGDKIRCFFIIGDDHDSTTKEESEQTNFSKNFGLSEILRRDLVYNIFDSKLETWGTLVFFPLPAEPSTEAEHAYINWKSRDLSNLRWFESPLKYHENPAELCSVYYSALNFRDVMLASGKLALSSLPNNLGLQDCVLGMEFSGVMPNGQRVMGLLPSQAMATTLIPQAETLYHVPKSWTLAEAATVPIAYSTGYYALIVRGGLQRGESVLIHCGAGAVGIAAIAIALSMDCKVFTTVGSMEKRKFLQNMFPQLCDSSFANSRDTSFLPHVLNETNGRGVDLVLNSLAGEKLESSIKCLAQHGRFLEIGKVDLFEDNNLGMAVLLKNVTVCGILLDSLFTTHQNGNDQNTNGHQNQVWELMNQGLKSGVVRRLPFTIFSDSNDEIERAFRFMATGKHRGKILLEFRKDEQETGNQSQILPLQKTVQALPRSYFDPNKSYVLVGGLGGFGLELAGFLIERGARHLILVSRSGVQSGYQSSRLRMWRERGIEILTTTLDVATMNGALALFDLNTSTNTSTILNTKNNPLPIGGIFNLAMDLADGFFEGQTVKNFQKASRPKIEVTKCLDKISREEKVAQHLDHFVVFSSLYVSHSVSSAAGLSTYGYANAAMERICAIRKRDGFPALAIQWGAIGQVGVLQNKIIDDSTSTKLIGGTIPQKISSCLRCLDILLNESRCDTQNKETPFEFQSHSSVLNCMIVPTPDEIQRRDGDSIHPDSSSGAAGSSGFNLMDKIAKILGMKPGDLNRMNLNTKLADIGMDSLMAVEIKQLIEMRANSQSLNRNSSFTTAGLLELTLEKIKELMDSENVKGSSKGLQAGQKREEMASKNKKPIQNGGKSIQNGGTTMSNPGKSIQNGGTIIQNGGTKIQNGDPSISKAVQDNLTKIPNSDSKIPSLDKIWTLFYQNWDLRGLFFYIVGSFALLITGTLCLISFVLRQGTQLYINIFRESTQLKIMSRPYDAIFAMNPQESNIAITVRCGGSPVKSKLVRTLNNRVIKWRTNIRLDKDNSNLEKDSEFYMPYEILRWRITKGLFFHYWQKDVDFDLDNHVIIDELPLDANLEDEARKVSEFYHSRQWENVSQLNKRPQWEFRVLVPKYSLNHPKESKEFLVVFAIHHGYCDAVSLLHLLQYALRDYSNDVKTKMALKKSPSELEQKSEKMEVIQQNSFDQHLQNLISTGKSSLVKIHNLICEISRVLQIQNGNTISLSHFKKSREGATKKFCGLVKLSLSEIKSLRYKNPQGKSVPVPLTTIVLTCATAAFEKMFTAYNNKNKSQNKKSVSIQGNLVSLMPYTIFPAKKLDLVNSLTTMQTSLATLNSNYPPGGQSRTGEMKSFERILDIGKRVEESSRREHLVNSNELNCLYSSLTNQLIGLLFKYFFPSPTFIYSNVPASIPRSSSFLGGYSVKDLYGDAMLVGQSIGALASVIDSETDTCALSLIIDERAKQISPEFHQDFFMYFQQELNQLVQIQKMKLNLELNQSQSQSQMSQS